MDKNPISYAALQARFIKEKEFSAKLWEKHRQTKKRLQECEDIIAKAPDVLKASQHLLEAAARLLVNALDCGNAIDPDTGEMFQDWKEFSDQIDHLQEVAKNAK